MAWFGPPQAAWCANVTAQAPDVALVRAAWMRSAATDLGQTGQMATTAGDTQRSAARCISCWENGPMGDKPGRYYGINATDRDRMIVQLRRAGWTYKRIGKRVGMSESGVLRAVQRIRDGGFGQ